MWLYQQYKPSVYTCANFGLVVAVVAWENCGPCTTKKICKDLRRCRGAPGDSLPLRPSHYGNRNQKRKSVVYFRSSIPSHGITHSVVCYTPTRKPIFPKIIRHGFYKPTPVMVYGSQGFPQTLTVSGRVVLTWMSETSVQGVSATLRCTATVWVNMYHMVLH